MASTAIVLFVWVGAFLLVLSFYLDQPPKRK
jgi:hypothetical protein